MDIRVIVITGASSSGKDHLCDQIKKFADGNIINDIHIINTDMFYKDLTPENILLANEGNYNFDEPNAIDEDALRELVNIVTNVKSNVYMTPIYNFSQHRRVGFIANDLNPMRSVELLYFKVSLLYAFHVYLKNVISRYF